MAILGVVQPDEPSEGHGDVDEFGVNLFAACDYGWPAWTLRKTIGLGFIRFGIFMEGIGRRWFHPMHPLHIFEEGQAVQHKALLGVAVVPTQRQSRLRNALWIVAAILALGELVGCIPGVGITDWLMGGKPFHPLYHFGLEQQPKDFSLVSELRNLGV